MQVLALITKAVDLGVGEVGGVTGVGEEHRDAVSKLQGLHGRLVVEAARN